MTVGLAIGALMGLGVLMVTKGLAGPAPRPLHLAIDRLHKERSTRVVADPAATTTQPHRWAALVNTPAAAAVLSPLDPDLAVVGKTRTQLSSELAIRMGAGAAIGLLLGVGLAAATQSSIRLTTAALFALAAALVITTAGIIDLRSTAKQRRTEFLDATTALIEFIRLGSSFRGVDGAMAAATRSGSGWAFAAFAAAIEDANRYGERSWEGLARLGRTYGVGELEELAATLSHSSLEGARVHQALEARARSLRTRQLGAELAKARAATTQLQAPLALLGMVVLAFLLYPSIAVLAGS